MARRNDDGRPFPRQIAAEQQAAFGLPEAEMVGRVTGCVHRGQHANRRPATAVAVSQRFPAHAPRSVVFRPRHLQESGRAASAAAIAAAPDAWSTWLWVTSTCASRAPSSARSSASRCCGSPVPASIGVGTWPGISHVVLPRHRSSGRVERVNGDRFQLTPSSPPSDDKRQHDVVDGNASDAPAAAELKSPAAATPSRAARCPMQCRAPP